MIFIVPEDFASSCVLPTLNMTVVAGMRVSITGNDLFAADIKYAVENEILIPEEEEYTDDMKNTSFNVIVKNKTKKVLVLEDFTLRPGGTLSISKDSAKSSFIISAEKNGLIEIISDEKKKTTKKKITKKKTAVKKTTKKKAEKKPEKTEEKTYIVPKTGEDREVTPKVWNFKSKEMQDAQPVPKSDDVVQIDKPEEENVDFIDDKEKKATPKKIASKKKTTKKAKVKTTKKRKVSKKATKKKEKEPKSKKVKTIEPIGEIKTEKTSVDAAIELDSRGNPIEKASDTLKHLIDSIDSGDELSFVDNEQAQERLNNRKNMD